MFVYRLLRQLLRFAVSVFYRQIEVVGLEHVPAEHHGAVIFAGNHPNSLLDPVLILARCTRIVHFAAKDTLFKSAPVRFLLTRLGAVPIARRADHGGDAPLDNERTFAALYAVLAAGRAMGIFPEGLSHDEAQLSTLKTGAARIALGVCEKHPEIDLRIVPCGLNYVHRKRFRSRVLMQFGPAIRVTPEHLALARRDPREAARALTAEVEQGMRALTVNAEDWDTLRVLDGVRRLYQPAHISLEQRVELARRFNDVYPQIRNDASVAALYQRVAGYLDRLDALGVTDAGIRDPARPGDIAARVARHLTLALVWLPLALPTAPVFLAMGGFIRLTSPALSPRKDVVATTKLVLGLLGAIALLGAIPVAIAWRYGSVAALAALALVVLSGIATIRVVERAAAVKNLVATLARLLAFRRELDALRIERAALEADVVAAVERHRPSDMVPLFPRGESARGVA